MSRLLLLGVIVVGIRYINGYFGYWSNLYSSSRGALDCSRSDCSDLFPVFHDGLCNRSSGWYSPTMECNYSWRGDSYSDRCENFPRRSYLAQLVYRCDREFVKNNKSTKAERHEKRVALLLFTIYSFRLLNFCTHDGVEFQ